MALEWVVLGYATAAEAIMLLALTLPVADRLRRGLVAVSRGALRPMLAVVPLCLFLVTDIYWKYERLPACSTSEHACTPTEHLRHQRSLMKSQRNALLIACALLLYWLLFAVTTLVVRIDQLSQRIDKLKNQD